PLLVKSKLRDADGFLTIGGRLKSMYRKKHGDLDLQWTGEIHAKDLTFLREKFRYAINGPLLVKGLEYKSTSDYSIAQINNVGKFGIEVRDESFHRPPVFRLDPLDINVKNIGTLHRDAPMNINLKAAVGKYDRVSIAGDLTAFAKVLNGTIRTKI